MLKTVKKILGMHYREGKIRRVLLGPIRGTRFRVAEGFGGSYAIGADALLINDLWNRLQKGMTVYDIGANRGHITLLFAAAVGDKGQVVSFEPVESLARAIEQHVALNKLKNVRVFAKALSNESGTIDFAFSNDRSTQGKISGVEPSVTVPGVQLITVQTESLDNIAHSLPGPDVIKIDVEGAAGLVLAGARATIEAHHPSIFVELHGPEEQAAVQRELVDKGYQAHTLDGRLIDDVNAQVSSPLWLVWPAARRDLSKAA